MHCILDNKKQKTPTGVQRNNLFKKLSKKRNLHLSLNNLKSENNISETILILTLNKVSFNMFNK